MSAKGYPDFIRYHRATGGCSAYCRDGRHAIPMLTCDMDRPIEEREAEMQERWPGLRLLDVIEATEFPREMDRIGHPINERNTCTLLTAGDYIPVLYIVEGSQP